MDLTTMSTHATTHGGTGFDPLAESDRRSSTDDLCCCPWCSADGTEQPARMGAVWDTLATDLVTGKTWHVHHPDLHGVEPLRPLHVPDAHSLRS